MWGYCSWGLWQHTLLGIFGLCGASGNTLYWVLLLIYVGVLLLAMRRLGQHTLLGIIGL
jgi:hypothetical protein